ncbi:Lipase_GDSL domain-containing protein/eIF-4B domain-containing protein, partial [Cephalotus follicularis]
PVRSSNFGSGFRSSVPEPDRWDRGGGLRELDRERPRLVLDPPKGETGLGEAVKSNRGNPFGSARPREEVLAEKGLDWKKLDLEIEAKKTTSRPTSAHSSRPSSAQSGRSEGADNVVKARPKVNPFGDAKPREVLLQERGQDWRKIDLQLEHRGIDRSVLHNFYLNLCKYEMKEWFSMPRRSQTTVDYSGLMLFFQTLAEDIALHRMPETEEEKIKKEEIDTLKANRESLQNSGEDQSRMNDIIFQKEKELEMLICDLDNKVRFGQKAIERPGSGAGRTAGFPERPPSQSGSFEESRSMEFIDRPRSRGTTDVWTRPGDDRKPFQGGRERGYLGSRDLDSVMAMAIVVVVVVAELPVSTRGCKFPAIYNFGDSNSDTGGVSATFGRVLPPNGETFFGKSSARHSDGRLIIDFIAKKLELPLLHAYLDSLDPNYRHGTNFALSGSTIQPADGKLVAAFFNPMSLNTQVSQFKQFKQRTIKLYSQAKSTLIKGTLPRPKDFPKAIYTLDCGQNDIHFWLTTAAAEEQVKASLIPNITNQFALLLEELYQEGVRTFWIHNTGPIGCLPFFVNSYPPKPGNADQNGCVKSYNEVAQELNKHLKEKVSQLRMRFSDSLLILVDVYSAKYSLISEAKQHGFVDPFEYCCGKWGVVGCGGTATVNGTSIYGASCSDPSKYISWDSIHYTDAANNWVANHIMDGSLSDPPIPLSKACHLLMN